MAAVQAHMKLDGGLFQPFMDVLKSMDSPLWNLLHSCYCKSIYIIMHGGLVAVCIMHAEVLN